MIPAFDCSVISFLIASGISIIQVSAFTAPVTHRDQGQEMAPVTFRDPENLRFRTVSK
jgi:hypothetical protein